MTQQIINIGIAVNDRSGDPIRTAFTKVNNNFTDLYEQLLIGSIHGLKGATGFTGAAGRTGATGSRGGYGNDGIDGATGLIGATGINGATGLVGATGVIGATGIKLGIGITEPIDNQFWFNTIDGRLYINDESVWVDAAPQIAQETFSGDYNDLINTPTNLLDRLSVGDKTLILNTDGKLSLPSGGSLGKYGVGTALINRHGVTLLSSADVGFYVAPVNNGNNVQITNGSNIWAFEDTGVLSLPLGGVISGKYGMGGDIGLKASSSNVVFMSNNSGYGQVIVQDYSVNIQTSPGNLGNSFNSWGFSQDGTMIFPNNAIAINTNLSIQSKLSDTYGPFGTAYFETGNGSVNGVNPGVYSGYFYIDVVNVNPDGTYTVSGHPHSIQNGTNPTYISGIDLGGISPENDLLLSVTTVSDIITGIVTTGTPLLHRWVFDTSGNLSFPGDLHSYKTIEIKAGTNNFTFSDGLSGDLTLPGGAAISTYGGQTVVYAGSGNNLKFNSGSNYLEFGTSGALIFPNGSTITDTTSSTLVLTPPGAQIGQNLVIRPTSAFALSSNGYIVPGSSLILTLIK